MTATADCMPIGKLRWPAPRCRSSAGFTYLGLLILVVIIGLLTATSLKMGSLMQRRAAEQALLDIGAQFADALKSYAAATPAGQPPQPPSIRELLNDLRFSVTRRHLRQNFVDPITGKTDWGVSYLANGVGVLGIHSLSNGVPLKVANFDPQFLGFEDKNAYRQWEFGIEQAHVEAGVVAAGKGALISPMGLYVSPDAPSSAMDKTGQEQPSAALPLLINPLELN